MKKNILIKSNKNIFNVQFITVKRANINIEIKEEDNIYISENGVIQTLWKLYKKTEEAYRFEKIKVIKDGCKNEDLKTLQNMKERVFYIENEEDIEYLNHIFEHKIKIYPQYNINNVLEKDIELINNLKRYDPKIEFYYNVITDNSQKASVAIIPTYGVCIIENFEEEKLGNIKNNIDNILDKLKQAKTLYNDEQLNDMKNNIILSEQNNLNINYKKYILCSTLDKNTINELNNLLKEKSNNIEFITIESLMNELLETSNADEIIVDEVKKYGIKCAIMPQYVIQKSSTVIQYDNGKIKIPQTTIELDEEQIRILDELNERTYIESTAGTGKSVLLLTKAYMLAKENPEKDFLFICFNNKLCEEIELQARYKNQQIENLKIRTFDKFIQEKFSNTNNWEENHRIFLEKVANR